MSGPALAAIRADLDRFAATGRVLRLWWRDDDAVRPGPELDRLLGLSGRAGLPVAVAVIPARVEPSLAARIREAPGARALIHGWRHANYAPPGAKPAEFGSHRPADAMSREVARGRDVIRATFGDLALDVFVPPWNRIGPEAAGRLSAAGYRGLSTFGPPRGAAPAPAGLVRVDAQIDPIDWRGTRGLAPPERIAAAIRRDLSGRLEGGADTALGLLTHHLVMDESVWSFCAALLDTLLSHPSVQIAELDRLWRIGDTT